MDRWDKKANEILRPYFRGDKTEHDIEEALATALYNVEQETLQQALEACEKEEAALDAKCNRVSCAEEKNNAFIQGAGVGCCIEAIVGLISNSKKSKKIERK